MSYKYTEMWKKLNINLEAHDQLIGILSEGYQTNFLSQSNRPEGMKYFDFVVSEIHGLRIQELVEARKEGKKIIGSFCVYVPEEIILALDAISIGLCSGAELAFEEAEKYVPRNTCALIKSAIGFNLAKVCPYIEVSDLVVGENTCDGKKKAYESIKDLVNDFHLMDLPQTKNSDSMKFFKTEIRRFIAKLEELTGKKLTFEKLQAAIKKVNKKRQAVARLNILRRNPNCPISGLDALLINQIYFNDDIDRFTGKVNELCDELEKKLETKQSGKRILVSGCPMAIPNWKLPAIVEQNGGHIIGEELCTGERGSFHLTAEDADTLEAQIDQIAERYMKIECAVFTPNEDRLERIKEMAKIYKADGVLLYNLQFCQPYQHESISIEKELENLNIPVLNIDTDYSMEDSGQLSTRIEAFIERLS
ncbi:MAG: double-cubane-cluster-containing anaerobic reductase [Candidatus Cloacimonadales bacterium]